MTGINPVRHCAAAYLAAAVCLGFGAAPSQAAEPYPDKPVTVIVPYGPGSSTDTVMRPVAIALQNAMGKAFVIDNKSGANGVIGTQIAARAKPDGYTLLVGSTTTLAANVGLFKSLPYDPLKDFVPVAGMGSTSMMIMVRPDFPAKDFKGFLEHAAKQSQTSPVTVGYGSSSAQVAVALLTRYSGSKFTAVPYKASPQALTDLIGGQVDVAIVDVGNGVQQLRANRLRALAISGVKRSVSAPEVPTLAETWPGAQLVTWIGLVAPAGTPPAIVEKLSSSIASALTTPELRQQFQTIATEIDPASPAELGRRMQRDQAHWLELIKAAGITPE